MALQWNWKDKMGKLTIRRKMKKYYINIYYGNFLAVFVYEYTDGGNKKQIWIEDIKSLKAKISLVNENKLAGIGSWQKDMESDEVWNMIKEELKIK